MSTDRPQKDVTADKIDKAAQNSPRPAETRQGDSIQKRVKKTPTTYVTKG